MPKERQRKQKRVPHFWWDFDHTEEGMKLIIESDHPSYPRVEEIASGNIAEAEQIVKDYREGRRILGKSKPK